MKYSSDKYKKSYPVFSGVRSKSRNQQIPIARAIFVLVPGLQNMIFSSNKNISACKKSARVGPFGPLLVLFAPFGPC